MRAKSKLILSILFLLTLTVVAAFIDLPNGPYLKIGNKQIFKKEIKVKEGLDLKGGAHLVYSADLSKVEDKEKDNQMRSLAEAMENRINRFGVTEPTIQVAKVGSDYRLNIELPGVKDSNEAINSIGKVAELQFKELNAEGTDFAPTGLTGKDLKSAAVDFDETGKPQIQLVFTAEGAKKFEEITGRNVGKSLATYLDENPVQIANVQQKISGGNAVITGNFDIKEAKTTAKLLNAGRLPVPVKLIEQRTVGATLGQESIKKSVFAGIVGIIFVSLFMIAYYRVLGIFSTIGLGLYLVFMIALIKIFGITMTMGGVAGLILSIGMSMETDVLVFERIREELRKGKSFITATKQGFAMAWPSVRDSNAVSLIIAGLLYTAGGTIRGFAVVLALGIIVGLATTFLGTRSLIGFLTRFKLSQKYSLYNVSKSEVEA